MIELRDITVNNWEQCINLKLLKEEKDLIWPNVYSIAQAQFYPKAMSKAIYIGDEMVGYTLFGQDEDDDNLFYIDRLMISKDHRRKNYAFETIRYIILTAKDKHYKRVGTSVDTNNPKMKSLLIKVGFYTNNDMDGEEIIYYYDID